MSKRATVAHLAGIELDRGAERPLHQQIDAAFRLAILEGRLSGGTRIPSSRALAEQLGVSRLTVVSAFEQLVAEGYLESRVGSRTTVARVLPGERFNGDRIGARTVSRRFTPRRVALSRRGASITAFSPRREAQHGAPRPFRRWAPALDAFPYAEWTRLSAACRRRISRDLLGYGEPAGYRPLREAIAAYLGPARGVRCSADNVVVVSGAQQAFGLALRLAIPLYAQTARLTTMLVPLTVALLVGSATAIASAVAIGWLFGASDRDAAVARAEVDHDADRDGRDRKGTRVSEYDASEVGPYLPGEDLTWTTRTTPSSSAAER